MKKPSEYASEHYGQGEQILTYSSKSERIRIGRLLDCVGEGKKVLDVGCYRGDIGEMLIKRGNAVWGIDSASEAVEIAKKKGVQAIVADLDAGFPFEAGIFDVVLAAEILEHMVDTDFFVQECARVLQAEGTLVISTPNVASLGRRIMLLFGANPYFEASLGFPPDARAGHLRFYTKRLLVDFLRHKGFEVTGFRSDVVNFTATICSKLLADLFPTLGRTLVVKARKLRG